MVRISVCTVDKFTVEMQSKVGIVASLHGKVKGLKITLAMQGHGLVS